MAGPAIRALELCRAVTAGGVDSTLLTLSSCTITDDLVRLASADSDVARNLIFGRTGVPRASSVILQGDVLNQLPWLAQADIPLVVDAYDPFHLEQLEQARVLGESRRRVVVRDCIATLNRQLARADLVLAASNRQRDLWLGHLAALGRINPVTYDDDSSVGRLLAVVPFGLPAEPPRPRSGLVMRGILNTVSEDSVIALWAGGVYDWFDPVLVLEAVALAADRNPLIRVVFLGGAHPVSEAAPTATTALRTRAAELGLLGSVVHLIDGWVPYVDRDRWLMEADVAVVAHRPGVESEFAFRTRVLDHLWAGLPTVGTGGDVLVDKIGAEGAGVTVQPGDVSAFAEALLFFANSTNNRDAASRASARLGARFRWSEVARPLADFCHAPRRAPDLSLSISERALLGVTPRSFQSGPINRVRAAVAEGGIRLLGHRLADRISRDKIGPS